MTGEDFKDDGRVLMLDRPRTFKLTWNTMRLLQKEYKSVESAMNKVADGDYDAILYLLWAAQTGQERLNFDELGELIEPDKFAEAFSTAFELSGTEPTKKKRLFRRKNASGPRR